jgi:BMFP domain-containing protein YqiC
MTQDNTKEKIAELETRIKKLEDALFSTDGVKTSVGGKKMSPNEFLRTKKIDTGTQKVLVLGYYLEKTDGMPSFNATDIEAIFRSAKEKLPANINDLVNSNVKKAFMDEAKEKKDGKKAWYLTSTGENYVEQELKN